MSYLSVPKDRIEGIRAIADNLTSNELILLVGMFGLRSMQDANIDLVCSGDCEPSDIANGEDSLTETAAEMMTDMINVHDIEQSIHDNINAADYAVEFEVRYVIARKKI